MTRADVLTCGYTEREVKTLTGPRGAWVVVGRGCYVERSLWEHLDEDGRYRLRVRAVGLVSHGEHVVSHTSAAALLAMPTRPRWRDVVHLTRRGVPDARPASTSRA